MYIRLAFLSQEIEKMFVLSKGKYYNKLGSKLNNPQSWTKDCRQIHENE